MIAKKQKDLARIYHDDWIRRGDAYVMSWWTWPDAFRDNRYIGLHTTQFWFRLK